MDPLVKKALFVLLTGVTIIGLTISVLYINREPSKENPYPWLELGTDTIIDLLWDPNATKFKEMPNNSTGFWVDDQAKLLWLMLENPAKYDTYINKTIQNLKSVWHDGYFPRRWVVLEPKIVNDDAANCNIENGFLRIMGDLSFENASNPLRIRYYEAAGYSDLIYLGGQLFVVVRKDRYFHWITYDPIHLRAEQCQSPGFDTWSLGATNEQMFLPWECNGPSNWYYSNNPPIGCAYSARWVFEQHNTGRCIGLERYSLGVAKNWRSSEFSVRGNTAYTWKFKYRGEFYSGSAFKAYLRWFDSSHALVYQNYTEFNTSYDSWQFFSNNYTSPNNAVYADILFLAEADSDGNYYFDNVQMTNCTILNSDFEDADGLSLSETEHHSKSKNASRSAQFYSINEYIREWLPVTANVSNFYNITYWCKSAVPPTDIGVLVFYSDGTYEEISKSCNSSSWILSAVQQSELSSNKIIVAFGFKTASTEIDTFIDDVGFHYKPTNAQRNSSVNQQIENASVQFVETVQNYADDDVEFEIHLRLNRHNASVDQIMEYQNKQSYGTEVLFTAALDGLSTVASGEGTQKTAYSSVWVPEIGRRNHTLGEYVTTLVYPEEQYKWRDQHNYFIVELKQIPEWAGCYGVAICDVPIDKFYTLQNSNPDPSSPYLHYLTYTFRFDVGSHVTETFNPKIICMNGYDFTNPAIYDYYLTRLSNFSTVDLSMNYHIGTVIHSLARYLEVKDYDPEELGTTAWEYYKRVFTSHDNGSYLLTTGKAIEASMIYYRKLSQEKYLDFAKVLGNYLVDLQVTNASDERYGTFPMKLNGITYLDCQGGCLIGLKMLRGYSSSYDQAYRLGISAIQYDYRPEGLKAIFDPRDYGCQSPNIKRLFVYSNCTHVDDDFFTFKSGHVALAAHEYNETLAMLALSRVWRNTVITPTNLTVYVCESVPSRIILGTRDDWVSTNSETQPYGLIPWLEIAKYQRKTYQYYYQFLLNDYAIVNTAMAKSSSTFNISGVNGLGTVSTFYTRGTEENAAPLTIKVDGQTISPIDSLQSLYAMNNSCYNFASENYTLVVKSLIKTGYYVNLEISWETRAPRLWMPMIPILGLLGFVMTAIALVYLIAEIKKKKP